MAQRDLYEVLGVERSASEKQIRKAYRELARKYHPDRNPGDKQAEERFKEASYASEILLNQDKRKLYDEFGEIGLREGFNAEAFRRYQQAGAGGRAGGFSGFSGLEDLFSQAGARGGGGSWSGSVQDLFGGDVVETIFGGRGRRKRDVVSEVTIEFAEAVRGAERDMNIVEPGQAPRQIKVRIPPGVRDGGRVRLRGQGQEGGDVVLHVHVREHPHFKRSGNDLLLDLPVTVGEAYAGARVSVPTPAGPVTVRIPKGVQSGAKLRLRGKGVPHGNLTGDLIARVQVVLPHDPGIAEAVATIEKAYSGSVRANIEF